MFKPGWFARQLVAGPPTLYLLLLFALPTLIMVAASFGWPGEAGGLSPLWWRDTQGLHFDLTTDNYRDMATTGIYAWLFLKSFVYAIAVTAICMALGYPLI